jgi:hypothetical protein
MPDHRNASWESSLNAQAMEAELYLIGKRAGSVAASAEWPHVARNRPNILTKAMQATQTLFGREGVTRNAGYCAGWVDGYHLRCRDLKQRELNG